MIITKLVLRKRDGRFVARVYRDGQPIFALVKESWQATHLDTIAQIEQMRGEYAHIDPQTIGGVWQDWREE